MTHIDPDLRREVINRAGNCCEYCLLSQEDYPFTFHIEHIIAEKHRGKTAFDNLCVSCPDCNVYKGSDLSPVDKKSGEIVTLFNPRKHRWRDHFRLNGAEIELLTPEGRVTVFLLRFNNPERLTERKFLMQLGRYPCQPQA
ncbi:MAG: HNH endonuclease [Chloroflexi bacterium]|nr:HNH endonuclease [Chloroflexota bacterium]